MKKISFEIRGRLIEGELIRKDSKFFTIKLSHDYIGKHDFWQASEEKSFSIKNCKHIKISCPEK